MTQQEYWNAVGMSKYYSHMYYVKSNPVISDAEFDALVAKIEQAEIAHPDWTLPDSPTQKVGSDLSDNGRRRIAHRTPMLSCQKAQTVEAVDKWLVKIRPNIRRDLGRFLLMWKYDGISCSLVYQDGKLIEASTRGEDGLIGQDILDHVRMMQNVPQQLEATNDFMRKSNALKGRVEVRGEVVCKKANLKLMRNQYKDCRSAASSLCNMMEPDPDCELLQFCVWDVIADRWNYGPEANIGLDMAKASGFKDVYYVTNDLEDGYHFGDVLQRYFDAEKREALEFPTDGVVIRVNHRGDFKDLGATAHHPKGSIAYKFAAAKTVSRVTRIEVTVGKTGRRTPVVHFEPVMILGREVKKASLGSERMLEEMGVKRGDMVEVGLANDVRPTIYRVIESNMDCTDMADPLEGIDFEGEESETKDWFTSEEETNTDCAGETDDVETMPTAPEVTAADLEAAVKACEERRRGIEQETREKATTGLELSQTGNKVTTDVTDDTENETNTNLTNETNKSSKALKIGAAIVGVLVIAVCGITALAASVFLAPVLVGAFKG